MTLSAAAVVFALGGGVPASAQGQGNPPPRDCNQTPNHPDCRDCPPVTDPYATTTTRPGRPCPPNPTTSTTQRGCRPLVEINITNGPPGVQVIVTVDLSCFPPGTLITITFNGTPIGTVTVGPNGQAALGGSGLAALNPANVLAQLKHLFGAQGSTSADIAFNVPSVSPGTYPVCAIVDGFEPGCTNFTVTGVGGAGLGRGGSSGGSSGSLTGAFASTGLALLPWLAIAAAAVAIGVALKRPARQRRITSN